MHMKKLLTTIIVSMAASCASGTETTAPAVPPAFTHKPTATKAGEAVKIEFAVDRETDVAVFVENAKGEIVRHLVAGVLGQNPPPPLKPGLAQSIEWNGKADYGKDAGAGPFKVRVAIGLGAKYDKVVHRDPQSLGGIYSLAVGTDGTLYVRMGIGAPWPGAASEGMVALNRDGTYQRMIMPYPSNLAKDQVPGVGVMDLDGRPAPVPNRMPNRNFYGATGFLKSGMAVTPEGQILFPLNDFRLAAVDREGAVPWGAFAGPRLVDAKLRCWGYQRVFVTVSADGKFAYLSGLGHTSTSASFESPFPAVYKVKLPERGPAEVLFGDPKATGNDQTHLGGVTTGLALDGKGNLLVGDPANKRVVVISEQNGKFAGSFPVETSDCVAADPATGAVYVTRITNGGNVIELVKFSGWKDAAAVASLNVTRDGNEMAPYVMALDPGAKPPVIWLGGNNGKLLRIEDQGAKFGEPRDMNPKTIGSGNFNDVSVDRLRKEVYARAGGYWRFSEAEGKVAAFKFTPTNMGLAQQLVPGPDGSVYVHGYPFKLEKFDHFGNRAVWSGLGVSWFDATTDMYVDTGHQLGVHPDGRVFAFENPVRAVQRSFRVLRAYGQDGKPHGWGPVWHVSEVAVGPKFDPAGNIYIAEQIRPKDTPFPPGMESSSYLYGSIVKFSPKGGMINNANPSMPPDGSKPQLDPGLKTQDAVFVKSENRLQPVSITGAEWIRMGVSHIDHSPCTCECISFDVDEFGRVFYPDLCRFRVVALDTAGNEITHFGGYGNAESMGPDSPVVDPQTQQVRPRRADDPKDLKSPFAEPEIAFAWLISVGVTDRYAYMGDTFNRRLLRARLVYAAEESCEVK